MKLKENLRMIWAITAKDLVEAIKNKNTIAVLLSTLFLVIMYRALPGLEKGDAPPNVLLYDAGESSLVAPLENSTAIKLYTYKSEAYMTDELANGDVPELGLMIPADFDRRLVSGSELKLQGYVLHWVKKQDALELKRFVENEIYSLLGVDVEIDIEAGTVISQADSTGVGLLSALGMAFVILITGLIIPPYLMLEEKQTRTIDVLVISPVSSSHIAIAKALAAMFYCLLTVSISFGLNYTLIYNWPLAILVALCGSLFAVSVGLLLGTIIETRQQLMLWGWVMLIPLALPMMLSIMKDLLPENLVAVFNVIPSTVIFSLFRVSFSDQPPFMSYGPGLFWLLACAGIIMAIMAWLIRRMDRH